VSILSTLWYEYGPAKKRYFSSMDWLYLNSESQAIIL
jgi:hypothetical protein